MKKVFLFNKSLDDKLKVLLKRKRIRLDLREEDSEVRVEFERIWVVKFESERKE